MEYRNESGKGRAEGAVGRACVDRARTGATETNAPHAGEPLILSAPPKYPNLVVHDYSVTTAGFLGDHQM